ncbi:hypothetical protein HY214_00450 [Candidatus Roizmanbacteria bacterium]|nr:hypothetical protein [Candidatus Roizmanbacteria bacterium]
MKKKVIIPAIGVSLAVVLFLLIKTYRRVPEGKKTTPVVSPVNRLSASVKEFTDPSGFSFQYPDNLELEKKEAANEDVYAKMVIGSSDFLGSITVDVETSKYKSLDDWLQKNNLKPVKPEKLKLGGADAVQTTLDGKLVTAAIDQGVIFLLTTDYQSNKSVWLDATNKIISSFTFTAPAAAGDNASVGGGDSVVDEGEETVE